MFLCKVFPPNTPNKQLERNNILKSNKKIKQKIKQKMKKNDLTWNVETNNFSPPVKIRPIIYKIAKHIEENPNAWAEENSAARPHTISFKGISLGNFHLFYAGESVSKSYELNEEERILINKTKKLHSEKMDEIILSEMEVLLEGYMDF